MLTSTPRLVFVFQLKFIMSILQLLLHIFYLGYGLTNGQSVVIEIYWTIVAVYNDFNLLGLLLYRQSIHFSQRLISCSSLSGPNRVHTPRYERTFISDPPAITTRPASAVVFCCCCLIGRSISANAARPVTAAPVDIQGLAPVERSVELWEGYSKVWKEETMAIEQWLVAKSKKMYEFM